MVYDFYFSKEYRTKQSLITKKNWALGKLDFLRKREERSCARNECGNTFEVSPSNPKKYCSQSCATITNNLKRGSLSVETRKKISKSHSGKVYLSRRGKTMSEFVCKNLSCGKVFLRESWRKSKFCSRECAISVIGSRITSPKAARGKSGIRADISKEICFYSRWEANIARLYNYTGIKWVYAPHTFDIGNQNYTPDFYLPKENKYVEVKNFWGEYSKRRHEKFKKHYPQIKLEVILKDTYLKLEDKYSKSIPNWEYKNSK